MATKERLLQDEKIQGNLLSGILLIAGTCIGAGMLALPVATGLAGFMPSMVINTVCWLFMLSTGLLLLEVTLYSKENANILTMAQNFLGPIGKFVSGFFFLFLYYCLEVSYISGGTPLLASIVKNFTGVVLGNSTSYLTFILLFGTIVYLGTRVMDRVNWLLMAGLILSYFWLIGVGSTQIETDLLVHADWKRSLAAIPVFFSAYGFHNVIPSVSTYLKRDAAKLRIAIFLGTTIPFFVYSLWQWMIIGTVPQAELQSAVAQGVPITHALEIIVGHPMINILGSFFGFFALITSFLGVSLSMLDFLADGLKKEATGCNRLLLCLLVFVPSMIFADQHPGIFIKAIGVAGGFGEAILNGLLPIAMVWIARYSMKLKGPHEIPGGKTVLALLTLFTFIVICLEIAAVASYWL